METASPTPIAGRSLIQGYGEGRIRISGQVYDHPVLVFPETVEVWPLEKGASPFDDPTGLEAVWRYRPQVEILLIGCGPRMLRLPAAVRASLREAGLASIDAMDSGAACRTFSVLLAEDRRVAAAIIPV